MIYAFDGYELDTQLYELRSHGTRNSLERQVFDVLAYLVEHRDRVVSKEELFDKIWGDRFVSEAALNSRIMAARKAVGDSGREQRIIQTVHGRGYRFVAPVTRGAQAPAETMASSPPDIAAARVGRTSPSLESQAAGHLVLNHPGRCPHFLRDSR